MAKFSLNKHIYPTEMDINRGADDQMLVLAAAAVAIDEEQLQKVRNRSADKEMWVRAWLIRRPLQGHYDNLMRELNREDRDEYVQFLRVTPEFFMELLEVIGPLIQKKPHKLSACIRCGIKTCHNTKIHWEWMHIQTS